MDRVLQTTFDKQNLLLLFHRPLESPLQPKGPNRITLDIPENLVPKDYQDDRISRRFVLRARGSTIPVAGVESYARSAPEPSALSLPESYTPSAPKFSIADCAKLSQDEMFSIFNPLHSSLAAQLVQIFCDAESPEQFFARAIEAKFQVNPHLFIYAYSVALIHREDTKDILLPSPHYFFTSKFIDGRVLAKARKMTALFPEDLIKPIEIPQEFTATDLEMEHRVAYFREDIGVNLHHWQWHVVYPFEANKKIVDKDRRGELFYYMHQQILARYNFERFSNKLNRVERFIDWDTPLAEAYFPKLACHVASRQYAPRAANQKLQNLSRDDGTYIDVLDLKKWRDRIRDAIDHGFVMLEDGNRLALREQGQKIERGIDILGNLIESSVLSINRGFYGDLHNMGHIMISLVHDPDNRNLEPSGVMGANETAMRDPAFYRWHAYINDLFQDYKLTLPSYTVDELYFKGVTVLDVGVKSKGDNSLRTYWDKRVINIAGGLDFDESSSSFKKLPVQITYLQHADFSYKIRVNNQKGRRIKGTCRIFLAPKFNERHHTWKFEDQRRLFIEMDKFLVRLKPGENMIIRESSNSSVTIPLEQVYRDLNPKELKTTSKAWCGCGWPENLLVPKGTPEGLECQLFVMISDYNHDRVDAAEHEDVRELNMPPVCDDDYSDCDIKHKPYPYRDDYSDCDTENKPYPCRDDYSDCGTENKSYPCWDDYSDYGTKNKPYPCSDDYSDCDTKNEPYPCNDDYSDCDTKKKPCPSKDAYSYCGTKNKRYPDRRAMGYPFDRKPVKVDATLEDFLTPNMKVVDVSIKFGGHKVFEN